MVGSTNASYTTKNPGSPPVVGSVPLQAELDVGIAADQRVGISSLSASPGTVCAPKIMAQCFVPVR